MSFVEISYKPEKGMYPIAFYHTDHNCCCDSEWFILQKCHYENEWIYAGGFIARIDSFHESFLSSFSALSKAIEVPIPLDKDITFGYGSEEDSSQFTPRTVTLNVNADPGYYTGYKSEGFFHLDFSENPFDGAIEIMVMGEPLPPSTVTLLVALGAGALLLLYKNRRTRGAEQA